MNIDDDIDRSAAIAFGPASLLEGGLLPFEARSAVMSPQGLHAEALELKQDGWLPPDVPVLVRGAARIVPLAWSGADGSGGESAVSTEEMIAFASQMDGACSYWARHRISLSQLDEAQMNSVASYAEALRTVGITRGSFWAFSKTIGLALIWAGDEVTGTISLAFHVVPTSWVSELCAEKPARDLDLRWSWADVIELYRTRADDAGEVSTEGS